MSVFGSSTAAPEKGGLKMIKAAAGWYETTSLRHPPPYGNDSGSKPSSHASVAIRGAVALPAVAQQMTRHNLVEVVAPRHSSHWCSRSDDNHFPVLHNDWNEIRNSSVSGIDGGGDELIG
ncbi:hypothetical protein Tco_1104363 [Tanacetum coccineum]